MIALPPPPCAGATGVASRETVGEALGVGRADGDEVAGDADEVDADSRATLAEGEALTDGVDADSLPDVSACVGFGVRDFSSVGLSDGRSVGVSVGRGVGAGVASSSASRTTTAHSAAGYPPIPHTSPRSRRTSAAARKTA